MSELARLNLRVEVPKKHCASDDSRLQWLWNQDFKTVANIYSRTRDIKTRLAATLIVNAVMLEDLASIELLLQRLEGGAISDEELLESDSTPL